MWLKFNSFGFGVFKNAYNPYIEYDWSTTLNNSNRELVNVGGSNINGLMYSGRGVAFDGNGQNIPVDIDAHIQTIYAMVDGSPTYDETAQDLTTYTINADDIVSIHSNYIFYDGIFTSEQKAFLDSNPEKFLYIDSGVIKSDILIQSEIDNVKSWFPMCETDGYIRDMVKYVEIERCLDETLDKSDLWDITDNGIVENGIFTFGEQIDEPVRLKSTAGAVALTDGSTYLVKWSQTTDDSLVPMLYSASLGHFYGNREFSAVGISTGTYFQFICYGTSGTIDNVSVSELIGIYGIVNYTDSCRDNAKNLQYGLQTNFWERDELGVPYGAKFDRIQSDGVGYTDTSSIIDNSMSGAIEVSLKQNTSYDYQIFGSDKIRIGFNANNLYIAMCDVVKTYSIITKNAYIPLMLTWNGVEFNVYVNNIPIERNINYNTVQDTNFLLSGSEYMTSAITPIELFRVHLKTLVPTKKAYYVSEIDGADTNIGSIDSPFKTIQYALTKIGINDIVVLRGGKHQITATLELTISNFSIYGYPGETAIISSMFSDSSWTNVSGDIYEFTTTNHVMNVSQDGVPMRLMIDATDFSGSSDDLTGPGQWSRNTADNKLWVWTADGTSPADNNIEMSYLFKTVDIPNTTSYIDFKDITIEGGYYPLHIEGDSINLINLVSRNSFADAIKVSGWSSGEVFNSENGLIDNCEVYNFGENGVDITGGDYWTIKNTTIRNGVANRTFSVSNGNKNNGIVIKNNAIGTVVDNCVIKDMTTLYGAILLGGDGYYGAEVPLAKDTVIKNNTISNISAPYIVSFSGATNTHFTNNILKNNHIVSIDTSITEPYSLVQLRNGVTHDGDIISTYDTFIERNKFYNNDSIDTPHFYNYCETVDGTEFGTVIDNDVVEGRASYFDGQEYTFAELQTDKGYDVNANQI